MMVKLHTPKSIINLHRIETLHPLSRIASIIHYKQHIRDQRKPKMTPTHTLSAHLSKVALRSWFCHGTASSGSSMDELRSDSRQTSGPAKNGVYDGTRAKWKVMGAPSGSAETEIMFMVRASKDS